MRVGEIIKVLEFKRGLDIYKVACRMLEDGDSIIDLCSSIEDKNKVQGICDWLEESSSRKPSANQLYVLRLFIAENLGHYGEVIDDESVSCVFNELVDSE